ncbi:FAD:protein FMN transferase [Thalassotalea insulae]|uniref:FAD:protein FMN transferase n=1 Tax=Thalassotalea insulae TaxID=2056778 RepID=A0ABQ6GTD5_9GAMM|nr:FAD:protein FMN transferase [Thalassotalea insulae]GLX77945.1 FAD:protein FMN transferase [Thalassotalea insulae]
MIREVECTKRDKGYAIIFDAMASPCEVLIDSPEQWLASLIGEQVAGEAWRIEDKYSRYQTTSVCGQLNANAGKKCPIDSETFHLLQFADQCYQLSDGLFDITSGVLRKAWHFDCSDNIPSQQQIDRLLPFVGWQQLEFDENHLQMQQGMEIDFGGIGKEYAVDKAILLANQVIAQHAKNSVPVLVNFGGDLAVNGPRDKEQAWHVGVEHPSLAAHSTMVVTIKQGAIATSGDAKRFLLKDGRRYSHVLNVKTGWPVENPPKSITVAAPKCIQAGLLATLALLQGKNATKFLKTQDITHWQIS